MEDVQYDEDGYAWAEAPPTPEDSEEEDTNVITSGEILPPSTLMNITLPLINNNQIQLDYVYTNLPIPMEELDDYILLYLAI